MILAIESSCDETSVAIVNGNEILSNELFSQIRHHRKYGGVVPELASRLHAEFIDVVLNRALGAANVSLSDIKYIAVTVGPGLEGALLVGVTAANMLSKLLNIPIIPVNHLHGHIYAALQSKGLDFPLLACIASGGHTMIVHMSDHLNFEIISNTMDDACGECFDKVARMLGLNYPGGPEIEREALQGVANISLPHPVKSSLNSFSFSGLKTAVLQSVQSFDTVPVQDVAASVQQQVASILSNKIKLALDAYPSKQLVLCGGVFSNECIRSSIQTECLGVDIIIPDKRLCTDNAAMIALAASIYIDHGYVASHAKIQTRLGMSLPEVFL